MLLACIMVPYAFALYTLNSLKENKLYPRLGRRANYAIASIYVALCAITSVYLYMEFDDLIWIRVGSYNLYDLIIGAIMVGLIFEFSRREHFPLFVLNIFLVLYALFGWAIPGIFSHPGLMPQRVITTLSVELNTGIFERLPQLGLSLIAAFFLFASIAIGFGCINSLINVVLKVSARSPYMIPQTSVIGGAATGTITGSAAADAAIVGSFTIPMMKEQKIPAVHASAIQVASSIGAQLMPPIMGVAAFIMAEMLGVSYWEVVARGYVPAIIYYLGVAFTVYLISRRYIQPSGLISSGSAKPVSFIDKFNTLIFAIGLASLIILMGCFYRPPMEAGLTGSLIILILFLLLNIYSSRKSSLSLKAFARSIGEKLLSSLKEFVKLTTEITLLLSVLGILTGIFTNTGVPTKIGMIIAEMGRENVLIFALIAFAFGYIVGLGVTPAATYLIVALAIIPAAVRLGFNLWPIHFYAFLLAVFSELSPPTSVAAAVTSKIAGTSFMKSMIYATMYSVPLFVLMVAMFTRPYIVIEPGIPQLLPGILALASSAGLSFCFFGKFHNNKLIDIPPRAMLALLSLLLILHPNIELSMLLLIPTIALIAFGLYRIGRIGK